MKTIPLIRGLSAKVDDDDRPIFIYGLKCPLFNKIRYVGKSVNPIQRFKNHINYEIKTDTHKARWLNKLIRLNMRPELVIIEETTRQLWEEREKFWIAFYRNDLTNESIGGDGRQAGWKHKEESIAKIIIALKCRSKEIRINAAKKTSAKLKGRKYSEQLKKKLSKSHKIFWNKLDPAGREKYIKHLRREWSEADKLKLSRSTRGRKRKIDATSKYIGVSWFKRDGCWRAWITINKKQIHIGYFNSELEAALAYDKKAIELHGEFAVTNFEI